MSLLSWRYTFFFCVYSVVVGFSFNSCAVHLSWSIQCWFFYCDGSFILILKQPTLIFGPTLTASLQSAKLFPYQKETSALLWFLGTQVPCLALSKNITELPHTGFTAMNHLLYPFLFLKIIVVIFLLADHLLSSLLESLSSLSSFSHQHFS